MKSKFKVVDRVKLKNERYYINYYNNPNKLATLPVAGMITKLTLDNWVHPYFGMSKHFEQKEIQVEIATISWFEYTIEDFGKADDINLREYNKNFNRLPVDRLSDFNKYLDSLKKKKELYK